MDSEGYNYGGDIEDIKINGELALGIYPKQESRSDCLTHRGLWLEDYGVCVGESDLFLKSLQKVPKNGIHYTRCNDYNEQGHCVDTSIEYFTQEDLKKVKKQKVEPFSSFTKPDKTLDIPMSPEYVKHWTAVHGVRELIANALDTETKTSMKYKDGVLEIEDQFNSPLEDQHWAIGFSQKTPGALGQFGEGLKVGLIALLRNGYTVSLESKGTTYIPYFAKSKEFGGITILKVDKYKNKRTKGTKVSVKGLPENVVEESKDLFPLNFRKSKVNVLDEHHKDQILDITGSRPSILIRGLKVTDDKLLLHSYNLWKKDIQDRDRDYIDEKLLDRELTTLYALTKNRKVMDSYLKALTDENRDTDTVELRLDVYPVDKALWSARAKSIYGKKTALEDSSQCNLRAEGFGYTILKGTTWEGKGFLERVGILPACQVVKDNFKPIPAELNEIQKAKLDDSLSKVKSAISDLGYPKLPKVRVYEQLSGHEQVMARWDPQKQEIMLLEQNVDNLPLPELTAEIMHEYTHSTSGQSDYTSGFENALSDYLGDSIYFARGHRRTLA